MAKLFLTSIDLNGNELQNAVIQNLAAAPSTPVNGQVYYDSDDNAFYGYNGAWVPFSGMTQEQIQDIVGAMVSGNTQTGITVTYEDGDGTIDFVVSTLDSLPAPTASLDLNNQKITNLAAPTAASDGATKGYVDSLINGLAWKDAVRVASTAPVDITTELENGDTLDGVTLATGDRVLLKNQTDAAENGIYVVAASGAASRSTDADSEEDLLAAAVFILEGTTNEATAWVLTTPAPIVVDTTDLVWAQFGAGSMMTAGDGISIVGNVVNVKIDGVTIGFNGSGELEVKDGVFAGVYSATIGDGSNTSYTLTHNMGTRDVDTVVRYAGSPYSEVEVDWAPATTNTVVVTFNVAPSNDEFRVTVFGVTQP